MSPMMHPLIADVNIPIAIIAERNVVSMWSTNAPDAIISCAIIATNHFARRILSIVCPMTVDVFTRLAITAVNRAASMSMIVAVPS